MNKISSNINIMLISIILNGAQCTELEFKEPIQNKFYDIPIINFKGVNQAIVYRTTNFNDDDRLVYLILKEVSENQAVLLFSGKIETTLKEAVNSKSPNLILLTEFLNIEDLKTITFKNLFLSHWMALYLVVTTRSQHFTCKNGTLTDKALDETKNYLNRLWHLFRTVKASVTFPYTCPMHYVIYDGQESSGTVLYNRGVKMISPKTRKEYATDLENSGEPRLLIKNYPLRVSIFHRTPTAISDCDVVKQYTNVDYTFSQGLCGLDGMVMQDFISHFRYKIIETEDENCNKYGYEKNNSVSGSLACILRREVDISFNSRFLWMYTTKKFHFLHYVSQDTLCMVCKSPAKIPLWHYPINMITISTWIWLLSGISLVGFIAWVKGKITAKITGATNIALHRNILYAMHSSFFGKLLENDQKDRLLKGTSLLCSIILLSVYQGHINNQFTTRSHRPIMKSIQQVQDSSQVINTQQALFNFMPPNSNNNNVKIQNFTSIDYLLEQSKTLIAANLERKRDIIVQVTYNHTDKYGKPEVYLIDMPFTMFYLSFIACEDFLFVEESQKFMMRLTEAGLPNQYYKWTGYTFTLTEGWPRVTEPEPRPCKSITMKKCRVAFVILFIGYLVSGLIFLIERWGNVKVPGWCTSK